MRAWTSIENSLLEYPNRGQIALRSTELDDYCDHDSLAIDKIDNKRNATLTVSGILSNRSRREIVENNRSMTP